MWPGTKPRRERVGALEIWLCYPTGVAVLMDRASAWGAALPRPLSAASFLLVATVRGPYPSPCIPGQPPPWGPPSTPPPPPQRVHRGSE